jgi:Fe-S cluster assembly scaffold protein SufB
VQGIPLNEQKRLANVAVDAVFDSVSIATTFREELSKAGVIFCSISEAVKEYPDLVRKHMGSVVSTFSGSLSGWRVGASNGTGNIHCSSSSSSSSSKRVWGRSGAL